MKPYHLQKTLLSEFGSFVLLDSSFSEKTYPSPGFEPGVVPNKVHLDCLATPTICSFSTG